MRRMFASVTLSLLLIALAPVGSPQAAPAWDYVQPDAAGDVYPNSNAKFYDIISLSGRVTEERELVWEMRFVDLDKVTGNPRYCIFFSIDGKAYQTGARFDAVGGTQTGQVTPFARCNWNGAGTSIGTPVLDIAGDRITVTITPTEIPELASGGVTITSILCKIGHSVPAVGGDDDIYDTLTPSVEPKDMVVKSAAAPENLTVLVSPPEPVHPGGQATFAVNITNLADADAEFNLSAEGLPENFDLEWSASTANATAGASHEATLIVRVAPDASPGEYPFTVWARGPLGGNASANVTLIVVEDVALDDGGPGPEGTDANATATAADQDEKATPGAPAVALLTVLALMVALRRRR